MKYNVLALLVLNFDECGERFLVNFRDTLNNNPQRFIPQYVSKV
jgi:hypothetical protein